MKISCVQIYILYRLLFTARCIDEGQFWHVTDYHYDFSYPEGGFSCYANKPTENRGQFGIGWCDSPWSLVNNSVFAMKQIQADVDFIIWTGDSVLHATNETAQLSVDINLEILDNITSLLRDAFPNATTYPSYGNHDYFPNGQFPVSENAIYRQMAQSWGPWLNSSEAVTTLTQGGFYTVLLPRGNIRLVSLNTNLYYTSDKLTANIPDPSGQFVWLDSVLTNAEANQEKVLIIAHVPPGIKTPDGFLWFYEEHNRRLNEIIQKHLDVIAAIHLGHDHEDEFKIYSRADGTPAIPVFLAPSITSWRYVSTSKTGRARNPGIRLVKYDRQTGQHLDYVQYYLDLDKANREGRATWEKLYEAKTAYGIPDLTPKSLSAIRGQFLSRDSSVIQSYFARMTGNGDVTTQCDKDCSHAIYCGMTNFEMTNYRKCLQEFSSAVGQRYDFLCSLLSFVFLFILLC